MFAKQKKDFFFERSITYYLCVCVCVCVCSYVYVYVHRYVDGAGPHVCG